MQTPALQFPIEPHLLTPFYQWLPKAWQDKLYPWTFWGFMQQGRPTPDQYENHIKASAVSPNYSSLK
jgi:hypothetical protein